MKRERRWRDDEGRLWRCDAYDHGPMCRQCELVVTAPLPACTSCNKPVRRVVATPKQGGWNYLNVPCLCRNHPNIGAPVPGRRAES